MSDKIVYLEINGVSTPIGRIHDVEDEGACFSYTKEYLESSNPKAISVSLPLARRDFSAEETKVFFDGLLPEGFTRREVARQLHADEADYLTILSGLGKECIAFFKRTSRRLKQPMKNLRWNRSSHLRKRGLLNPLK